MQIAERLLLYRSFINELSSTMLLFSSVCGRLAVAQARDNRTEQYSTCQVGGLSRLGEDRVTRPLVSALVKCAVTLM